jgi:PhnB protein
MAVKSIPDGFTTATPYLHVRDAAAAIAFWKNAFGAEETMRMSMPDGKIGHAEVRIGNAIIMLADEAPDWGNKSPHTLGGTSFGMCLYVDDCDAVFQKALAAGATELRPMIDQFYGDRSGTVVDPFGHVWTIATHQEDVSAAEMEARMAAWAQSSAAA